MKILNENNDRFKTIEFSAGEYILHLCTVTSEIDVFHKTVNLTQQDYGVKKFNQKGLITVLKMAYRYAKENGYKKLVFTPANDELFIRYSSIAKRLKATQVNGAVCQEFIFHI